MIVALVGLMWDTNCGDPLLFDCSGWMCREVTSGEAEVKYLDFWGRDAKATGISSQNMKSFVRGFVASLVKKLAPITANKIRKFFFERSLEWKKIQDYYLRELQDVDMVIVMGAGTIKYDVRTDFGPYYKLLIESVKKLNREVPVFVSCVGIESKYRADDARCRYFSEVLSDPIVKGITTRDDIDELRKYIHNNQTAVRKVADIATWSSDCYNIRKSNSETIGVGIIVYRRFIEFNKGITKDQYEQEILKIVSCLDKQGKAWKFFTNGDLEDTEYARYICALSGNPPERLLVPTSPKELVEIVSGFKGIITSRLHSCITAYSLGIPFVAICWNNKLKYFAENIHVPERIVEADRFRAETIMKEFEKALGNGYDLKFREEYKDTVRKSFEEFMALAGYKMN